MKRLFIRRARSGWRGTAALPPDVRELAQAAYSKFIKDHNHPSLRRHLLDDTHRGRHRKEIWSVSIGKYRAIYVEDGDTNVWYWIGSHNDYENFTGRK